MVIKGITSGRGKVWQSFVYSKKEADASQDLSRTEMREQRRTSVPTGGRQKAVREEKEGKG